MSKAPAMPMYWDAYLADTTHLMTEEHGAYLLLLAAMWRRNGAVPDSDKDNARIVGMTPAKWRRVKARLVETISGFHVENGSITQEKLRKTWENTQEKIIKNRENGARGGRPKSKDSNELAKPNGSVSVNPNESIPEPEPEPEKKDPPKPPKGGGRDEGEFEDWWGGVPRKVGKGAARRAYWRARKKADADTLKASMRRFAFSVQDKDPSYIAHPATWLNGERWADVEGVSVPATTMTHGERLAVRVQRAQDWLSRNDTVPTWMADEDIGHELVKLGHDYDRLRDAGFDLPARKNVVNLRASNG